MSGPSIINEGQKCGKSLEEVVAYAANAREAAVNLSQHARTLADKIVGETSERPPSKSEAEPDRPGLVGQLANNLEAIEHNISLARTHLERI